jgi:outer membrane immunogenic protein
MKKLLASIAGLALLSASAFAADMAPAPVYKAPPPPAPAANWTGCSINGGYGYGMYSADATVETFPGLAPLAPSETAGGRGWLGRVGGGCDYQFGVNGLGNWVVGVLADYDVMDIHGNLEPPALVVAGEEKETSAWYAGGRIGYLVTPDLLTYFDGGYTQTHFDGVNLTTVAGATPLTLGSHTYSGYFLGGGLEYALNFTWLPVHGLFWRNEYRVANYSSTDLPMPGVPPGLGLHITPYTQTVVSSLVWRFP